MSDFKIEKGVPVPPSRGGRRTVYPWRDMEVGDSALIPGGDQARIGASVRTFGLSAGRKFVTRKVEGGVRVWRVK